jgi:hypothetical protein
MAIGSKRVCRHSFPFLIQPDAVVLLSSSQPRHPGAGVSPRSTDAASSTGGSLDGDGRPSTADVAAEVAATDGAAALGALGSDSDAAARSAPAAAASDGVAVVAAPVPAAAAAGAGDGVAASPAASTTLQAACVRSFASAAACGDWDTAALLHTPSPANSPLKWFGMVVPTSLGLAQKHFLQGMCGGLLAALCCAASLTTAVRVCVCAYCPAALQSAVAIAAKAKKLDALCRGVDGGAAGSAATAPATP